MIMKGCLLLIITQLMIKLVISSLCARFEYVTNATYGDLAGVTQYVKYAGSNDANVHNSFSTEVDSILMKTVRIGEHNDYNHTLKMIHKSGVVASTSKLFSVNETEHILFEDDVPEKYFIISYKADKYALIYFCSDSENIMVRLLCTTNPSNNVSQALEDDKKYNFAYPLVELPFKNKELIENEI